MPATSTDKIQEDIDLMRQAYHQRQAEAAATPCPLLRCTIYLSSVILTLWIIASLLLCFCL